MRQIRVRVTTGIKKETIKKLVDGRWAVAVSEPATAGRANQRTRELLAEYFDVPIDKIKLVSGHTSPSKIFYIPD